MDMYGEIPCSKEMPKRKYSLKNNTHKNQSGGHHDDHHFIVDEALRRAEATLEEAQSLSHLGSWDWDLAADTVKFSDEMFRLVGMIPGKMEITRAIFEKFLHPDEAEQILLQFYQGTSHSSRHIEHKIILPNGEIRNMQTRIKAYKDEHGKPLRLLGSTQNITEHKRVAEALRLAEIDYRSIFEKAPVGIFRSTLDGLFIKVNQEMARLYGYRSPEEMIIEVKSISEQLYSDPMLREQFALLLAAHDDVVGFESQDVRKDGSLFWTSMNARLVKNTAGEPQHYEGFIIDITKRKRADKERYALLHIMRGLTSVYGMQDFFQLIHYSIAEVIPAENFFVILYRKEKGLFEEVFAMDKYDPLLTPSSKLERSITSYVFRTGEPLLLTPQRFDELLTSGEVELIGARPACWLGVPLKTQNGVFGVIAVQDYENPNCYSERDKDFLAFISAQIALGIEHKYALDELVAAKESVRLVNLGLQQALAREQRVSRTDSLTETNNRRFFFEVASHEFAVAKRYGQPLSISIFDIDHFKGFNDKYGHQVGDEILINVAQIAQEQLRDADIFARYGGEEFVVLLPKCGAHDSEIVAERIRESVAAYQMDVDGNKVSVTISVGVAECLESTVSLDEFVQQADKAMYAAKDAGRNCVVVYSA